ncbi:MAG TPA: hypothetical protein VGW33_04825 [Terriglobia bacterium]|nr:hypothetical protein [Terriglobia bacterium]
MRSADGTGSIVLCEPQCWAFEHASFNAALLQTVALAEPQSRLVFMGEGGHLAGVREELARYGCDPERVEWREIRIPPRTLGGWRRLNSERDWCGCTLRAAAGAKALILCSATATGLMVLKGMLGVRRGRAPVLATLHGVLASIDQPQPRKPWHWATSLRQVLQLPHPKQLTYLVLGASIRASLVEAMPAAAVHFEAVDLPYLMPADDRGITPPDGLIRFGFFGAGRADEKGLDKFFRLAREVNHHELGARGEFVMVGFLADVDIATPEGSPVEASRHPLSSEEYSNRARHLTYALGIADPLHYRLVASASFFDGLRYGKPGIYLRNPYLEYYFGRLGDVGYLCDSYEEVRDVVLSTLREFPEMRYRQQCENIWRGRELFQPRSVADALGSIIERAWQRLAERSRGRSLRRLGGAR